MRMNILKMRRLILYSLLLISTIAKAQENNNPVIHGYYADPEILYAQKTKKFYLYPTNDGLKNWASTSFKVYSSSNLTNWKDEGTVLELGKDVSWATQKAWAPAIIEKKIKGKYQYFFYFSAEGKYIGVASSNSPTGPFKDIGKPLIDKRQDGVKAGSIFDPAVFTDPITGKSYLYWGNRVLNVAELNENMLSLKTETMGVIKTDKTYGEGSYVFFRKGLYYLMWSENSTLSPEYRVRYATSKTPTGPFSPPDKNLVIAKDSVAGIYATGHNSVIQVPGRDEWYIVYHRFEYPDGIKRGKEAGYFRETCIDRLSFNEDGSIIQVKPTLEGILPIENKPKKKL